jgi:hypothetical protein
MMVGFFIASDLFGLPARREQLVLMGEEKVRSWQASALLLCQAMKWK